jgi:hypothetical protein
MTDIESIKQGDRVADDAEALRQDLRWNVKPSADRTKQIENMLESIRVVMVPIRSAIGRAQFGQIAPSIEARLREVSDRLQYQRKQLKKMRR